MVGGLARKILSKTRSNLDDLIVDKLEEPLVLALTIIALRTGYGQLSFGDGVDEFCGRGDESGLCPQHHVGHRPAWWTPSS